MDHAESITPPVECPVAAFAAGHTLSIWATLPPGGSLGYPNFGLLKPKCDDSRLGSLDEGDDEPSPVVSSSFGIHTDIDGSRPPAHFVARITLRREPFSVGRFLGW